MGKLAWEPHFKVNAVIGGVDIQKGDIMPHVEDAEKIADKLYDNGASYAEAVEEVSYTDADGHPQIDWVPVYTEGRKA